jgi:hypothetical protein
MEELLSTDNIHREILDDAGRKAQKLLKGAQESVASMAAEWDGKLQKAVAEVQTRNDAEIDAKKAEGKARLAMDKARAKLAQVSGGLESAVFAFFRDLAQPDRLAVLERALSLRLASVKAGSGPDDDGGFSRLQVETCGISRAETEALLGRFSLVAARIDERAAVNDELPSIVLSTGDIKITASLQVEADSILREKRSEAVEALFG